MNSSFPKAKRTGIFENKGQGNPSPTKYNPLPSFMIGIKDRGYSMQEKEVNRSQLKENSTPGPGTYSIQKKWVAEKG